MSKFGPEQRARIFAESRRLLADEPASHKEPPTPEPPLTIETQDARWRRELEDFERKRAASGAAMQREKREEREGMARARALDGVEERVTVLEQRADKIEEQISELARALGDFSDAVSEGMLKQDKGLEKLSTLLTSMRAADDVHRAAVLDMPSPLIRKERVN
jgi:hypothetical protein